VSSSRSVACALLAALVVAGCQPLPRPFQDPAKDQNELLRLNNRGGVVVVPLENVPDGPAFAEAVALELRKLEVPATTRLGSGEALLLGGKAEITGQDGLRDQLEIGWRIAGPTGTIMGGRHGSWMVPREAWQKADPQVMAAVAAQAAPELANAIEGPRPVTQPGPPLVVWAVDGAPGDGAVTLKAALERALGLAGYRILPDLADNAVIVSGAVHLDPPASGRQKVTIIWSVLDQDGSELGQISQDNTIPTGQLDGPWGEVARQIAGAALEGIAEVIDQIHKQSGG